MLAPNQHDTKRSNKHLKRKGEGRGGGSGGGKGNNAGGGKGKGAGKGGGGKDPEQQRIAEELKLALVSAEEVALQAKYDHLEKTMLDAGAREDYGFAGAVKKELTKLDKELKAIARKLGPMTEKTMDHNSHSDYESDDSKPPKKSRRARS